VYNTDSDKELDIIRRFHLGDFFFGRFSTAGNGGSGSDQRPCSRAGCGAGAEQGGHIRCPLPLGPRKMGSSSICVTICDSYMIVI